MTCNQVIINWVLNNGLDVNGCKTVYNHNIENDLKSYAEMFWNKKHNSGTWTRAFRGFKADNDLLKKYDLKITETKSKTKEKGWIIAKQRNSL